MDNFQRILSNDEIRMTSERSSASKKVSLNELFLIIKIMRIYRVCGNNGCRLSDTILFSFNRESCFRIWTKENPALNVEKNALDLACTCGGKHELKAHKPCLFFTSF